MVVSLMQLVSNTKVNPLKPLFLLQPR